jgi:hypothetical protein
VKEEAGRLGAGAARGRMDADESAAEMASKTSDDRIANVGGGVERETGGERKATKLGVPRWYFYSTITRPPAPTSAHPFPENGRSSHSSVGVASAGHQMIRSSLW